MHTQEIFKKLCESDPDLLWDDGRVHQANVAKRCKMTQPTVKRILDSEHGSVSDKSVQKIAECFGITNAQARGEVPLPDKFYRSSGFEWAEDDDMVVSDNDLTLLDLYKKAGLEEKIAAHYILDSAKKHKSIMKHLISVINELHSQNLGIAINDGRTLKKSRPK